MAITDESDRMSDEKKTTTDAPGGGVVTAVGVPRGGWRDRARSKPGLGALYRIAVFVVGLAFIAGGFGLAVLPGPLTIPPVLLGLWIWSTEFRFAEKLFDKFRAKARVAWQHAKEHPVMDTAITVGGMVAGGVAYWAVSHYQLIDQARDYVGM